eukprot:3308414-Amphidinium_carterae.1
MPPSSLLCDKSSFFKYIMSSPQQLDKKWCEVPLPALPEYCSNELSYHQIHNNYLMYLLSATLLGGSDRTRVTAYTWKCSAELVVAKLQGVQPHQHSDQSCIPSPTPE